MKNLASKVSMTILMLTTAGLFSCRSNPYPDQGQLVQDKPTKPAKVFALDVPERVDFKEGSPGSFSVKPYVPSGNPILTMEGLPKGAVYSQANNRVDWTPDFNAANDVNNPLTVERIYPVDLTLKDPTSSVEVLQKTILLVVQDTPLNFSLLNFNPSARFSEGALYTVDIQVASGDFPQGPFIPMGNGLPPEAQILPDAKTPSLFHLKFFPDYGFVTPQDGRYKRINWELVFVDPRGHRLTTKVQWIVNSNRQYAKVFAPNNVNQGPPDVSFMLHVVDLNGEVVPKVTVDQPTSIGGAVTLDLTTSGVGGPGQKPYQVVGVHWANIPTTAAGKKVNLSFRSCVLNTNGSPNLCGTTNVPVYINGGKP